MTESIFRHRSGRVIATGRLVLAAAFLLAILIDPSQPNQRPDVAYALLIGYVLWAAGLIWLTWRNWWLDFRLAGPSHLIDIVAFGLVVFFTEGYTSPFFTFFVFLLLSAAIRWGWRETALTATLVLFLYMAAGTAALLVGAGPFDLQRLLVRSTYLVVLSLVFVWFAINQRSVSTSTTAPDLDPRSAEEPSPARQVVTLAAERLQAGRILFAWSQKEEPWQHFTWLDQTRIGTERIGPEDQKPLFSENAGDRPFLFHSSRGRGLCRPSGIRSLRSFRLNLEPAIAERFGVDEGLMIPIRARDYEGELIAMNIEGMSADDLETAQSVGHEVTSLFDQASMIAVSEEAAVTRARLSLARDLHDSVVQVLAGASFRLEALKSLPSGGELEGEIDSVKADLAAEQRNVRKFIDSLRSGRNSPAPSDLRIGLPVLMEQLCRRWNLDCRLSTPDEPIVVPVWMEHELHQIIREAAANAARHGRATSLQVEVETYEDELAIVIADDGAGLPSPGDEEAAANGAGPWSVKERVHGLGGSVSLFSAPTGCRLDIVVPMGGHA